MSLKIKTLEAFQGRSECHVFYTVSVYTENSSDNYSYTSFMIMPFVSQLVWIEGKHQQ